MSTAIRSRAAGLLSWVLSAVLVGGCTTVEQVAALDVPRQPVPSRRGELVLSTGGFWSARLEPNTDVQLVLPDGRVTDWVEGRDLWISSLGISFDHQGGIAFFEWSEIAGVRLRNFSGGKTFGVIVLVPAAVALVLAGMKGGGGGGGADLIRFVAGSIHAAATSAQPAPWPGRPAAGAPRPLLPRPASGGHIHYALSVLVPPAPPVQPTASPPACARRPASRDPQIVDIQEQPCPAAPAPVPAPAVQPVSVRAAPLFDGRANRRAWVRLLATSDGGADMTRDDDGATASVLAGLRIRDLLELAGGFRFLTSSVRPSAGPESVHSSFVGVGRVGLHLELDSARYLAIPLGAEVGGSRDVEIFFRLDLGLRVNVLRNLALGLFPFNPTFAKFSGSSALAGARRWTFPTTGELCFTY